MSADDADTAARNAAARLRQVATRAEHCQGIQTRPNAELIAEAQAWAVLALFEQLRYGVVTVTAYTLQP